MANTKSAKKAIRSSAKKRQHNLFWKNRIKKSVKELKKTQTPEQISTLQKVLDKAAKNHVIHRNKANRLKSRFAKRQPSL